jgi:hypothetical protein
VKVHTAVHAIRISIAPIVSTSRAVMMTPSSVDRALDPRVNGRHGAPRHRRNCRLRCLGAGSRAQAEQPRREGDGVRGRWSRGRTCLHYGRRGRACGRRLHGLQPCDISQHGARPAIRVCAVGFPCRSWQAEYCSAPSCDAVRALRRHNGGTRPCADSRWRRGTPFCLVPARVEHAGHHVGLTPLPPPVPPQLSWFESLGVDVEDSDMSFSVSRRTGTEV